MSQTNSNPCRWLIDIGFVLKTPMHLGNGQDEESQKDDQQVWRAGIMLDHNGKPCIPGASLKGALRALAERQHILDDKLKPLFGHVDGDTSIAGLAEFRYAFAQKEVKEEFRPHVAIDRVTGTAQDKKLFETRLVPAGTEFKTTIVIHRADEDDVKALLGLLEQAAADANFSLGAHASQGLGAIEQVTTCARRFGKGEAKKWLADGAKAGSWESHACKIDLAPNSKPLTRHVPSLPLKLEFSSPFLVKGGVESRNKHDVTVPMLCGDKVILPASSLRGSLRSQAERILRTLGLPVEQGHEAKPWRKGDKHNDLAALLFGTAGWRAVIGAQDCIDQEKSKLKTQELVAIDRFTGGGLDGAKYAIEAAECPTLVGELRIDFARLKALGDDKCWPALGLFTLLLRDLVEGDINFGYGSAKGYGRCTETGILAAWEAMLGKQFDKQAAPLEHALASLRKEITKTIDSAQPLNVDTPVQQNDFKPTHATNGFLNPYHFIPLSEPDPEKWTSPETLRSERGHDQYRGLSGRITCTLTTQTPLFIGAERTEDKNGGPTIVKGYEFRGKRAIPATSLRGMISSLFESISTSRFRVLHPQTYSMRKTEGSLSAMGRIVVQDRRYYLKPLTLPTLRQEQGQNYPLARKWRTVNAFSLKKTEGLAPLRVYFDDSNRAKYQHPGPYYMELSSIDWDAESISPMVGIRHPSRSNQFLIGQLPQGHAPLSEAEFKQLPAAQQETYFPGWVRTLQTFERPAGPNALLPNTVRHLVFLPDLLPDSLDNLLPITLTAFNTFHQLADLATASMPKDAKINDGNLLPFVPRGRAQGTDRLKHGENRFTRLQHGDLVFFDVNDQGKISEISFSSMWRTGVRKADSQTLATTADLLAKFSADLLPLGMGGGEPRFSPVELLFGCVEYRPTTNKKSSLESQDTRQALALAGRVAVGLATAESVSLDAAVTLKELSSPKPPSPALYFKPLNGNAYVSKKALAENSGGYTLRGRKMYVHAWRKDGALVKLNAQGQGSTDGRLPWVSKHDGQPDEGHKRRVKVEPISSGQNFKFNVDFHNLNEAELQQLCATLWPDPSFEHRLGMGKPLGLGSVEIEIASLELVDRKRRYGEDGLATPRFHQTFSADDCNKLAAAGMNSAPPAVRRALELLGNPAAVGAPVHYPQLAGGELENEHFKWFMANDNTANNAVQGNRQHLKSLEANSQGLPTLPRYQGLTQEAAQAAGNRGNRNRPHGNAHGRGGPPGRR